jgi:ATP synthase protein I
MGDPPATVRAFRKAIDLRRPVFAIVMGGHCDGCDKDAARMPDEKTEREDAELHSRLGALKSAIAKEKADVREAEARQSAVGPAPETARGVAAGMRIVSELVAGVLVGGVGGYFLDRWLDTTPWLLIIGLLLGSAAGFNNVYKLGMKPTGFVKKKDDDRGG